MRSTKNKKERASLSLEAALALPLFLLVFLQLGLSLYAVEAEMAVFSALQRISKESNLILSAQRQLSRSPEEGETSLSALFKDSLSTRLGSALIEERLSVWQGELYENPLNFQILKNVRVYFQSPTKGSLGRLKLFYKIPGLWEDLDGEQCLLLNDWRGLGPEDADSEAGGREAGGEEHDYWSWDNFSRGQAFIAKYGGNLSRFHPVVAKNEDGRVTMIKSIDLTKASYRSQKELSTTLEEYLSDLKSFQGSEETGPLKSKKMLVIVPENSPYTNLQILESFKIRVKASGIEFEVVRDGLSH